MIYFILLIELIAFVLFYDIAKAKRGRQLAFLVSFLSLFLLSALKYRVGTDIIAYADEYSNEVLPLWKVDFEYIFLSFNRQPGWQLLTSLCRSITPSFLLVQIIVSAFVNWTIFSFLRKYCPLPFLGILLYYVLCYIQFNFEVLRQSISVAFLLIGMKYYFNEKWGKFLLCVLGGVAFHMSSLVLLLFPLIKKCDRVVFLKKKWVHLLLAVVIVVSLKYLIGYFPTLLARISGLGGQASIAAIYGKEELFDNITFSYFGNIKMFIVNYIIVFLLVKKKDMWYSPFALLYMYIAMVALAFPIAYRFMYYFIPFYIVGLTTTIAYCRIDRKLALLFFAVLFTYTTYERYTNDWEGIPNYRMYYPYHSYFDMTKDQERENRAYKLLY